MLARSSQNEGRRGSLQLGGLVSFLSLLAMGVVPVRDLPGQAHQELHASELFRIDADETDLLPIGRSSSGMLAVSGRGLLAIGQRQDHSVLVFDQNGREIGRFGRKGDGPGEISNTLSLAWHGDSLLIRTGPLGAGQRYIVLDPSLAFQRDWPLPRSLVTPASSGPMLPPITRAVTPDGDLVLTVQFRDGKLPSWSGMTGSATSAVLVTDLQGSLLRVLGAQATGDCHVERPDGGRFPIPMCIDPPFAVAADGSTAIFSDLGDVDEQRSTVTVWSISSTGTERYRREFEVDRMAIPRDQLRQERDLLTSGNPALKSLVPDRILPQWYPPIREIVLGVDGSSALRLGSDDTQHVWLILKPDGDPLGEISFPLNVTLRAILGDSVWATEQDSDGFEDVVRYALRP